MFRVLLRLTVVFCGGRVVGGCVWGVGWGVWGVCVWGGPGLSLCSGTDSHALPLMISCID